jgi:YggT family protein
MSGMADILRITINYFCNFLYIAILARVILSWFPGARGFKIVLFLFAITDPILNPIRSVIQKSPLGGPGMVLDFSPIIAFFLIQLIERLLMSLIMYL